MSTLYVVGTPIGNLDDLSTRAIEVLREVSVIATEDTRVTRKLLNRIGSVAKTMSYHQHNAISAAPRVMAALRHGDVALVSDAGVPTVRDPGAELVATAAEEGHPVRVVPGPSSVTAALAVSGIRADRFVFAGFLPRKASDRREELRAAAARTETTVCFETPQRLRASLGHMVEWMPDRRIAVCRELTKIHEETFRGTPSQALEHFTEPRGEFVIVIEGGIPESAEPSQESIEGCIRTLETEGRSGRALVDEVTRQTGAPRRQVYRLVLARAKG